MPNCDVCGLEVSGSNGLRDRNSFICNPCLHVHGYRLCPVCNYFQDSYNFCDSMNMCYRCAERETGEPVPRPPRPYTHYGEVDIWDYDYKPKFQMYDMGEKTNLYYGIELEVEWGNLSAAIRQRICEMLPEEFYLKRDGSLHDGVEIVCHPMSRDYLRQSAWNTILKTWENAGCESHTTTTCGMHIHMSLDAFTRLQLFKLMELLRRNKDFVLSITGRTQAQLDRWAYLDQYEWSCEKAATKSQAGNDRHSAINLATGVTMELRIFRGTLDPTEFWRNVEIAECLYVFTRDFSMNQMDAHVLYNYVQDHRQQYPRFAASLKGERYEPKRRTSCV